MAIETLAPGWSESTPGAGSITASWLGRVEYHEALALQKRLVAERADGATGDRLLLLEHPPVLTLGRTADAAHIRAAPLLLAGRGIEVDVTPGIPHGSINPKSARSTVTLRAMP